MIKPGKDKAQLVTLEAMQAAAIAVMNAPYSRQDHGPVFLAVRIVSAGSAKPLMVTKKENDQDGYP